MRPRDVKPSDWKAVGDIDKRPENSHTRFEHDIQAKVLHLHDRSDRVTAPHSFPVWLNAMGSDFWDPLDVAVFTTWVVGTPVLPGSAIARSAIPAVPSRHLFSVQSKPLDFACSFGLPNLGEPPNPRSWGNTSTPTSLRFFFEAEGQKAEVGVILLRSIPLLSGALRDPTAPGRRAPSPSLLSLAPKPRGGLGLVFPVIPSAFDLVHTARVVEGDDSRDR